MGTWFDYPVVQLVLWIMGALVEIWNQDGHRFRAPESDVGETQPVAGRHSGRALLLEYREE